MAKIKNEYGQLVEHWFEVRCYVDGKSDAKVTFCRTRKQAEKILNKQRSSGKYEMCYIAHLTEEEEIDEYNRVPTGQYAGNRGAEMNKIKEIRKAKKMRLRELSAATGIVIQTISRYELGQQKLTLDAAMKIAAALGVKVEELI